MFLFKSLQYPESELRTILSEMTLSNNDMFDLCRYQNISANLAREFTHKLNWQAMSCKFLESDFIYEFKDYLDFSILNNANSHCLNKNYFMMGYHVFRGIKFNESDEDFEVIMYCFKNYKNIFKMCIEKDLIPEKIEEYLLIG